MESAAKWVVVIACVCAPAPLPGDGPVKLQTAAPGCGDDSGDVFVDCGNGTVTDNRTGLVWLKNADCLGVDVDWYTATEFAAGLSDLPDVTQDCGLTDGSSPGEWRLATLRELVDVGNPQSGSSFINATDTPFWSENTATLGSGNATSWDFPGTDFSPKSSDVARAWPVRGGQ